MTQAVEEESNKLWDEAHQLGIILVPFGGGEGHMSAAITEEFLDAFMKKNGLDPDSWDDIYDLGLGFFVETAAPGTGDTRLEAYQAALKAYVDMDIKKVNLEMLERLNASGTEGS